ncbi:hypothetical protein [Prosthecobacter sp.]|uniref:hypothetical protein n=1 Tax=Prosthecobacter sp. TaxID=1965333 RepID=UPI003782EE0E
MHTPPLPPRGPSASRLPPPVPYQMAAVSDDDSAQPPPTACVNCGASEFSTRTQMFVCEPCRMDLVRRPFPLWVKLCTFVVFVMVVVSLALSRGHFQEARLFARAKKMQNQQRWEEAYQTWHDLVRRHRDTASLLNYAEMAASSGHYADAALALNALENRSGTKSELNQASRVRELLVRSLPVVAQPPPPALTPPANPFGDFSKFQQQQDPSSPQFDP